MRRNTRCPPGWLTGLLLGCLGIGDKERIHSSGSLPKCSAGYGEASHNLPNLVLRYPQMNLKLAARRLIDSNLAAPPLLAGLWTLIRTRHEPDRYLPSTFFDTVPLAPSRQACAKTIGAVFDEFVE
jgi:hypothetical protein